MKEHDDIVDCSIWYANLVQQNMNPHLADRSWMDCFEGSIQSWLDKFEMMSRGR